MNNTPLRTAIVSLVDVMKPHTEYNNTLSQYLSSHRNVGQTEEFKWALIGDYQKIYDKVYYEKMQEILIMSKPKRSIIHKLKLDE